MRNVKYAVLLHHSGVGMHLVMQYLDFAIAYLLQAGTPVPIVIKQYWHIV